MCRGKSWLPNFLAKSCTALRGRFRNVQHFRDFFTEELAGSGTTVFKFPVPRAMRLTKIAHPMSDTLLLLGFEHQSFR